MNRFCKQAGVTLSLLLSLAVTMAMVTGSVNAQSAGQSLVRVDAVRAEPMSQTVPVIGALVAKQTGDVAVEIGGTVRDLKVDVGDRVKQGQVIALLEADTRRARADVLKAELAEQQALLQVAEADLALAKQNMDRQGKLKKSNAFNRSVYEQRQQSYARALAQISRAKASIAGKKAAIAVLALEISKAKIVSPYDGVVIARKTEKGSYVRSGDAVVTLIADDRLEVEANVPAIRIAGLAKGVQVKAELEDGTQFTARVRATLPVENPRTRTRPVRFVPLWPKGIARLANAQSVTLYLPTGAARQVVTVHKDAIVNKRGHNVVFIVRNGKAEQRKVTLGASNGGRIEVMAGLKSGDIAVVRGNERLSPGAAVKIVTGS